MWKVRCFSIFPAEHTCWFRLQWAVHGQYQKCFQTHSRHLVQQCRTGDHVHYKMFLVKREMSLYFPTQSYWTHLPILRVRFIYIYIYIHSSNQTSIAAANIRNNTWVSWTTISHTFVMQFKVPSMYMCGRNENWESWRHPTGHFQNTCCNQYPTNLIVIFLHKELHTWASPRIHI
jgi:hypothetical protein